MYSPGPSTSFQTCGIGGRWSVSVVAAAALAEASDSKPDALISMFSISGGDGCVVCFGSDGNGSGVGIGGGA